MKRRVIIVAALALLPISNAFAQHDTMNMGGMEMGSKSDKVATIEGVGVVDNIDKAKGKVTLSHEPIESLKWPAMTMDFAVEDKTFFNKLIVGKKVNFQFIKQGNHYLVTGVK
jgi:Cu/Ag efflux protein CusF